MYRIGRLMRVLFTFFSLLTVLLAEAQSREEFLDLHFIPTKSSPFYYAITEKKDSTWLQKTYYLSTSKIARECLYQDQNCTMPHGTYRLFDVEGYLKETGRFANGKKEGLWLGFDSTGFVIDSGIYVNGHLKGVRMKWHPDGMQSDSMNFDGAGNGVQISWYEDGNLASAGYWTQDTLKKGRWKYFFHDGTIKATEDYVDGKISVCNCYTEKGDPIDTALCRKKEASPGDYTVWMRSIQGNLQRLVEDLAAGGTKAGTYTVLIKFSVLEDGSLSDFSPKTRFGRGVEEDVIKILSSAPKWEPGRLFGKPVKSYHELPLTFVIMKQ